MFIRGDTDHAAVQSLPGRIVSSAALVVATSTTATSTAKLPAFMPEVCSARILPPAVLPIAVVVVSPLQANGRPMVASPNLGLLALTDILRIAAVTVVQATLPVALVGTAFAEFTIAVLVDPTVAVYRHAI